MPTRMTRRITLALRVFGRAETKWIFDGASGLPMSRATRSFELGFERSNAESLSVDRLPFDHS